MSKQEMTAAPVCSWVAVTDASGRTHMEARWSVPVQASTPTVSQAGTQAA